MNEVKYTTTSVDHRRAGHVVLVSEAEHGQSLVVPDDPGRTHTPLPPADRAVALVRASGRLLYLFRDALRAAGALDFRPAVTVFEVLSYLPAGNTDCYRTPEFGALELDYHAALAWVTGLGVPPQVRRFVERLVDHERGETTRNPAEEGECEASPDTASTSPSSSDWPGILSDLKAGG